MFVRHVLRYLATPHPAVLAVAVAAVWFLVRDEPAAPDAGDCLRKPTPSTFETADCGSTGARYVVLGRVENRTDEDARDVSIICARWPDATFDYWREQPGSKGVVICAKER
ncbi:hypothetical protein [Dactylosporangium sp. NPDC006015]|uniref:LppU/SCO3897 family protein n=1 Tax=Dactylosporangium sp. NPDC006015 TaxID=3154576 RepID=UPI0033A1FB22